MDLYPGVGIAKGLNGLRTKSGHKNWNCSNKGLGVRNCARNRLLPFCCNFEFEFPVQANVVTLGSRFLVKLYLASGRDGTGTEL